jgi:6-pyruvoyl-tetrahydropterin synthase
MSEVYGVCVRDWLSVALRIVSLPDFNRVHGHDYVVFVCVEGKLGINNIVMDHEDLARYLEACKNSIDYTYLNESLETDNPTAEAVASTLKKCLEVKLSETWKEYDVKLVLIAVCTPRGRCSYVRTVYEDSNRVS